ncbi:MAG: hypothetical protein ACYDDZ_06720 [Acidimicrobiales bacterium]
MAVSVQSPLALHSFGVGVKDELRTQWLDRHRVPEDFYILWDLYWDQLGPLAPIPSSIHELEEVLLA